jgi:hypothetical protein
MKKKTINQCTIDYGGNEYAVRPNGNEDTDGSGGLWDLSKDFTEKLLLEFDSDILKNNYFERGAERIQYEMYRFLQYHFLYSLRTQLDPQNNSGSEM